MSKEKKTDIVYLIIHKRLHEKSRGYPLNKRDVEIILGKLYHVPRHLRFVVLKEMEHLGLIILRRRSIDVLECDFDLDDCKTIYQKVGIY